MTHERRPLKTRSTALASLLLAAAFSIAAAGPLAASATIVEVSANAAVNVSGNTNGEPLLQAAAGAEAVAKSSGLSAAIAAAWRTVWEKSWPFIKGSIAHFFELIGQAWRSIAGSVTTGMNVNADAGVNASTNSAVNAAP